jgi:hypothetical protein
MKSTPSIEENSGGGELHYLLYGPKDEGWTVRVVSQELGRYLPHGIQDSLGLSYEEFNAMTAQEEVAHEIDFLKIHGHGHEYKHVIPEGASPPPRWSAERRDALVMMVFYFTEGYRNHGPFPSRLTLRAPGIPETLWGTFRNPIWERLHPPPFWSPANLVKRPKQATRAAIDRWRSGRVTKG